MSVRRKGFAVALRLGAVALVLTLTLVPAAQSRGQAGGTYIALGDSIANGRGAISYSKSYVQLYFGYLQSIGTGVTEVLNTGVPGIGTKQLIGEQLPRALAVIKSSTAVTAVTIDIGINDVPFDKPCADASSAACPWAADLRLILTSLSTALASHDPGVKIQVMQYFNAAVGTSLQSAVRLELLGSDLKVDCAGTGAALGLNDLIHCVALQEGAIPIDVMPAFDAAGTSYIASDGVHPNDAGHLAIAKAFGGAAEPKLPPVVLASCWVPGVTGKSLTSARRIIVASQCAVGKITYRKSNRARKGIVLLQRPKAGPQLANRARISLTVSRGHS
jgi:lysophospholipase L1-like esterase